MHGGLWRCIRVVGGVWRSVVVTSAGIRLVAGVIVPSTQTLAVLVRTGHWVRPLAGRRSTMVVIIRWVRWARVSWMRQNEHGRRQTVRGRHFAWRMVMAATAVLCRRRSCVWIATAAWPSVSHSLVLLSVPVWRRVGSEHVRDREGDGAAPRPAGHGGATSGRGAH